MLRSALKGSPGVTVPRRASRGRRSSSPEAGYYYRLQLFYLLAFDLPARCITLQLAKFLLEVSNFQSIICFRKRFIQIQTKRR
jgi:hypothetical protein